MKKIIKKLFLFVIISSFVTSFQLSVTAADPLTEVEGKLEELGAEGYAKELMESAEEKAESPPLPSDEEKLSPEGTIYALEGIEDRHYIHTEDGKVYELNDQTGEITELPGATLSDLAEEGATNIGEYTKEDGWQPTTEGPKILPGLNLEPGEITEEHYEEKTQPGPPGTKPSEPEEEEGPETLKDIKFSVGEILSLDKEEQPREYFESEETPIVAFILGIINFAIRIIGSIAIIILIIGGFMFMLAQGNQQKLDQAKDVLKYAIIGLIVTFLSYIIVIFVQSLFV